MLENIAHTDGENTTLMLACATGGATDAKLKAVKFDWDKLKERLKKPKVGQKDGPYYVRGGELAGERRTTENLLSGELIILDGDSSLDPETGEITPGAPPMAAVCDALDGMGITYFAHTSHSFQKGKLEKYRVIIPAKLKNEAELNASVDYLIAQLHAKGVWLADVNENHKWIQPWFFSRVKDDQALREFVCRENNAQKFSVKLAVSYAKELAQQESVEKNAVFSHRPQPVEGNIQKFNHSCDISYVRSLLEQAGYRFCFYQKGKDAYKFIRPGSESGQPGVTVMRGTQGDWCVYSHHGSGAIPGNRFLDPFALTTVLKFNEDMKAAARALLPKEPTITERLAERASIERATIERAVDERASEPTFTEPTAHERASAEPTSKRRLELIRASDLVDVPVKWLVDGILPADSFAAIYGKPGSYKSFAALYLSAMIATGREAFGGSTTAGPVVYIAAEGGAGLKRRKDALWLQHDLPADAPLFFIKAQVNLFSTLEDRDAIVEAINELAIQPKLVVIDTMARASSGADENSVKDMSQVINIMASIQDEFGATVMFVHHSGKAENGMRGSSALLGAVDAEIECSKLSQDGASEKIGRLSITKMKDAEDQGQFFFKMETKSLSQIDAEASSLALVPIEGAELERYQVKKAKGGRKLTGNQSEALKALQFAIDSYGVQPNISLDYAPKGTRAIRKELWEATWETRTALEKDAFKKAKQRTPQMLAEANQICIHAGWVWIADNSNTKNPASFEAGFPGDRKGNQGETFDDIPFD
ncbi:regulatory protein repA [Caudoviricetes sp.]|nr:regulatory protein repA [Caudoviricetes sp.]